MIMENWEMLESPEQMIMENWKMLKSPEQMMKHCSPEQMMDCLEMLQSPYRMKKHLEMLQSRKMSASTDMKKYLDADSIYMQTEDRILFWEKILKEPSAWEQRLLNCLAGNIYWRARLHHIDQALLLQSPETKVYYRHQTGYPTNRVIDIITQASTVVIIVAYDLQALTKKETHKRKKRGAGRRGSISESLSESLDGVLKIQEIIWKNILVTNIKKIGGPQVGFYVSQDIHRDCDPALHSKCWGGGERAKGGAGRDGSIGRDRNGEGDCDLALHIKSWGGGKRAKGGARRDESIGKDRDGEVIPNINGDREPALHIKSWGGGEREKGGAGRDGSIGRDRDGEAILNISRDRDPALHIKSWGGGEREKGGAGRDRSIGRDRDGEVNPNIDRDRDPARYIKSWGGRDRAKGGAGRDESIGRDRDRDREASPNINRDCDPALHSKRPDISQANGRAERRGECSDGLKGESANKSTCRGRDQERSGPCGSECRDRGEGSGSGESQEGCGFGSECGEVKGEGSRSVESDCRDAEGEESRSGASQDRDGEGEGSSSGESQGRDREVGSASGEGQGRDRNAEGGGSRDDEDERERERRDRGDREHGRQESDQEEIDFSTIPETFMCIIVAITIAAVDFHYNGAISSRILGFLIAINVVGFLCCMISMLYRHREATAARIFGTVGAAAAGLGLLLLVSVPFSSFYRWMILGMGSLAILVIFVLALMSC